MGPIVQKNCTPGSAIKSGNRPVVISAVLMACQRDYYYVLIVPQAVHRRARHLVFAFCCCCCYAEQAGNPFRRLFHKLVIVGPGSKRPNVLTSYFRLITTKF